MPLPGFDALMARADANRPGVTVVAAGGADLTVLQALRQACDRGWVQPALTGDTDEICRLASDHGIALDGMRLLAGDPGRAAVAEVRAGRASLLMKGQIATPALMQAVLDSQAGLRTGRVICQVVLMEIPRDDRRFLLADTGITPLPRLEQKLDILHSAVTLAHTLGEPSPRVAVMSATEKASPGLPDTQDALELQTRSEKGEIPGCLVQGPLSFDLAYASEAGERKRIAGPVTGAADIMLFPDLVSANLTVKAIMYTADCRFGGVLCGTACPVVFMSRADSTETRLRSLSLALGLAG